MNHRTGDLTSGLNSGMDSNDPFGMSRFSIRRYSVQHFLLVLLTNLLLAAMTVVAALQGNLPLLALSAATLAVVLLLTGLVFRVGLRTIAVEAWIRRLGMGDFEFRIPPRGNDEVSKACLALDTLRLNCIKAMQLDLVTQLSDELRQRNQDLEQAMSDLRESQDRIISQQKLAELGELSSGVAHQMRNPLQFIANFTGASRELAQELAEELTGSLEAEGRESGSVESGSVESGSVESGSVESGGAGDALNGDPQRALDLVSDIADNLERVEHHSGRLRGIVSSMMIYDRGTGGGFRPVNLNRLLEEQTNLGYQAVQAHEPAFEADIAFQLDPAIEEVMAVPEDLARVIVNLAMNACQSMAEKRRDQAGQRGTQPGIQYIPRLTVATERSGSGVTITVTDNGSGISEDTMARMFNPFFTTWQTGRNSGLGLSLVWDIVREHGGAIEAASDPGDGATLTVSLPDIPGHGE